MCSDNKNTNAGHAYGGAVKYARRKFYEVVFNIETSDKDIINSETIEDAPITPEVQKPPFYAIDGLPKGKLVYDNGTYRDLTEDEQPMKEAYLWTLKSEVNKIYKNRAEEIFKLLMSKCRVRAFEAIPLKVYKEFCMSKVDIEHYTKIERVI